MSIKVPARQDARYIKARARRMGKLVCELLEWAPDGGLSIQHDRERGEWVAQADNGIPSWGSTPEAALNSLHRRLMGTP